MRDAAAAGVTGSTIAVGVDADPVARFEICYILSGFYNNTGKFMSQDCRRRYLNGTFVPLENMYVCAAYAARLNRNQRLLRPILGFSYSSTLISCLP